MNRLWLLIALIIVTTSSCHPQPVSEPEDIVLPDEPSPVDEPICNEPCKDDCMQRPSPVRGIFIPNCALGCPDHLSHLIEVVASSDLNTIVLDLDHISANDLDNILTRLSDNSIYPIGRITTLDNPHLAQQHPDWTITDSDQPSDRWLDPDNPEVVNHIINRCLFAAEHGIRELVIKGLRLPGPGDLSLADRTAIVTNLLSQIKGTLQHLDIDISITVTGYAASALGDSGIGHDLTHISTIVPIVSPTLYPADFIPGTFGITDPIAKPGDLTATALSSALQASSPDQLRPWLQDCPCLGPEGITAQIKAANTARTGWILYSPDGIYTPAIDYAAKRDPENDTATSSFEPLLPNELGKTMILCYHEVGQTESRWTRSRQNFVSDLNRLYEKGYRLVSLSDFVQGNINIERGYSPVILTFDDSTKGQFQLIQSDGFLIVDPDSAVGLLTEFYRRHPDFGFEATFYILLLHPFGRPSLSHYKLQWLVEVGLDLGNHTLNHANLAQTSPEEIQRQLALPVNSIEAITGYTMDTLALPYGSLPRDISLIISGSYSDISYYNRASLLVGAEPAPSPFSIDFDPYRLPRIQAIDSELNRWLTHFEKNPDQRYVSDGNADTISFPRDLLPTLIQDIDDKTIAPY